MRLEFIDFAIILGVLTFTIGTGALVAARSGRNSSEYFLSGRSLSGIWLGLSMVATTFATDTPGLVTDLVRTNGVAGNWAWWAFLLTGMLTVFLYARLWRRSGVSTDLEFYELRYSGKAASFLRAFRALYLGVFFNVIVMSVVSLAAIKIGSIMLGFSPWQTLSLALLATLVFSTLGGFRAVVLTDCALFAVAMLGAIAAAYFALKHSTVGGLEGLLTHANVTDKLRLIPEWNWSDEAARNNLVTILIIPLAVQWWNVWYPGAEPGGGGYLAQRMLAAKNENHAVGAVMFFNVAHYAIRPWPWILVALASMIVFPEIADIREAFPNVEESKLGHDLAYPAMLTLVPPGWLGLIIASLLAAYMSTISTHLNWGASYVVNDFYQRFVEPDASERKLVLVGRVSTVIMMLVASVLALALNTASQGFQILLQIGAGTGLIYILRWYWWRINAYGEIVAMFVSFVLACYFQFGPHAGLPDWQKLCLSVLITSASWIATIFVTKPESDETLERFCRLIQPGGPGWRGVYQEAAAKGAPIETSNDENSIPQGILRMVLGTVSVYSMLFAIGLALYGRMSSCGAMVLVCCVSGGLLAATYRSKHRAYASD